MNDKEDIKDEDEKKPDENSGVYLEDHIKIFDPETQEVFVDGRGTSVK